MSRRVPRRSALALSDDVLLLLVETSLLIHCLTILCFNATIFYSRELEVALEFNGVSATEDMAMVAQIKAEVRKLSNRNDIYNSICALEKEEQLEENTKQMIYIPPTPKTPKQLMEVNKYTHSVIYFYLCFNVWRHKVTFFVYLQRVQH